MTLLELIFLPTTRLLGQFFSVFSSSSRSRGFSCTYLFMRKWKYYIDQNYYTDAFTANDKENRTRTDVEVERARERQYYCFQLRTLQDYKRLLNGIIINTMIDLKCQQKFGMGFAYDYHKQIENTLIESIPSEVKAKCSIKKIVRSVCNLIKINPLETSLLSWLLARSKYDIEKISIQSRTNIVEQDYDHKVLIYTLLNAYYVKVFVCQHISLEIETDILNHVSNFNSLYNKFNPEKSLKSLSLSEVNKIFEDWTCKQKKKNKTDYNGLVDRILYLSKTYNVGGNEEIPQKQKYLQRQQKMERIPRKKRKVEEEMREDRVSVTQKQKTFSNKGANRFPNSQEVHDFLNPSQERRDDMLDMNPLRRSTRNMFQSFHFNQMVPSQDNIFGSQLSGLGLFSSAHHPQKLQEPKKQLKLKHTSSYDQALQ